MARATGPGSARAATPDGRGRRPSSSRTRKHSFARATVSATAGTDQAQGQAAARTHAAQRATRRHWEAALTTPMAAMPRRRPLRTRSRQVGTRIPLVRTTDLEALQMQPAIRPRLAHSWRRHAAAKGTRVALHTQRYCHPADSLTRLVAMVLTRQALREALPAVMPRQLECPVHRLMRMPAMPRDRGLGTVVTPTQSARDRPHLISDPLGMWAAIREW